MIFVDKIEELRSWRFDQNLRARKIALVPTMGALHKGHLSLIEIAKQRAEKVALSIFVNPRQFNSPSDLSAYPRTLQEDLKLAENSGVDLVFAPEVSQIYPVQGEITKVTAGSRSSGLCGAARPGHFDGVVQVVSILFNLFEPDFVIFGEKDYQQLKVIEQLVRDLHYRVQVIPGPLVRDPDGLALSSRNVRLSSAARSQALSISSSLFAARDLVLRGERNSATIINFVCERLKQAAAEQIDYVSVVDVEDLTALDQISTQAQLMVAAFFGGVRLIDNARLEYKSNL